MSWAVFFSGIVKFLNNFFERLQLNEQEELGRLRVEVEALRTENDNLRRIIDSSRLPNDPKSDPFNRDNWKTN